MNLTQNDPNVVKKNVSVRWSVKRQLFSFEKHKVTETIWPVRFSEPLGFWRVWLILSAAIVFHVSTKLWQTTIDDFIVVKTLKLVLESVAYLAQKRRVEDIKVPMDTKLMGTRFSQSTSSATDAVDLC